MHVDRDESDLGSWMLRLLLPPDMDKESVDFVLDDDTLTACSTEQLRTYDPGFWDSRFWFA